MKLYGHPPKVEELEDDENEQSVELKKSGGKCIDHYLKVSTNPLEQIKEESKVNIAYLEQNNSLLFKEEDNENFTFSHNYETGFQSRKTKIKKIAYAYDFKSIRACQSTRSGSLLAIGTNSAALKIYSLQGIADKSTVQELKLISQISEIHKKHQKDLVAHK